MHKSLRYILLLIFCFAVSFVAEAQLAKNKFGKNRLQYKVFNWRHYSTNNLDIYFYDDGQKLAKVTAEFMENEYVRITDLLGYQPYTKTKVFLYNSIADLQQSNVGVNENNFTVGGQTNFVKSHVEVAFPGTLEKFKEELVYEVSHMLIMDMMFGGSLTDIFQNTYLMTLPQWFIEGASRYVAYGWSVEMDDYIRDMLRDGKMPKINKVEGHAAGIVGQSVWNYIAERYGRSSISHILNYTRIIRNEETAISNTLGVPFKYFMVEWRSFYHEMAADAFKNYRVPSEEQIIGNRRKGNGIYNSLAFSPDGRFMAFTENFRGRYRIRLRNLETGKTKTVFKKGYRILDQETDDTVPVVAWQNNETLGIIGVEKGQYTLYLYSIVSDKSTSQVISKISQVNDFKFSPNGKVIVMSAEKEGENDIYLYSISRNTLRAITNDLYDDVNPAFMPGTNDIIFSSNRKTDTLNANVGELDEITKNYNLFIFNIDTTRNILTRVTNTISKDIKPVVDSLGNIYYLSEQKGIYNLFRYNMQDSLYKQLTSLSTSIENYALDVERNRLAYIALYDGDEKVFLEEDFNPRTENFTAPTKRQNTVQARYVLRNLQGGRNRPALPAPANRPPAALLPDSLKPDLGLPDSLQNVLPPDTLAVAVPPDSVQQEVAQQQEAEPAEVNEDTRPINTDDYVFDKEVENEQNVTQAPKQESFLSTYRKLRRQNTLRGPFAHEPRFMVNSMVTSLVFDPLRSSIGASGIGFVLEGQMNDMLENHKIYGGVMAMADLRSGDFFMEYEFLKYLLDFNVRVDRRVVIQQFDTDKHKYILNKIQAGVSLPLNVSTRITGGPLLATSRFLHIPASATVNTGARDSTDMQTFYAGLNLEMVYDNTIIKGFNLYNGTQAKIQLTQMSGLDESAMGFGKLTVEAKNYLPISRDFILATRGYFGSFLGQNHPRFILGGMDNWINHSTEVQEKNDPFFPESGQSNRRMVDNRNLLFHEFVTPMRGFNFNAHNGKNVLLFNAELRFPLIKYFYRGPISSNFFRNLQVVGFYDIGSAWTGVPPFMRENSINTVAKLPPENPFRAVIQNYKNPWLSSFGFGVRTVLLGYYAKFDVAYPMEDYKVSDARFYLTLGYDF